MTDEHVEIIHQKNSPMTNLLSTVGAGLVIVLLSWVAFTQTHILSTVAVVVANQQHQTVAQAQEMLSLNALYAEHERLIQRVWPRLRALDSNIEILKDEIQDAHPGTKVELVQPQRF